MRRIKHLNVVFFYSFLPFRYLNIHKSYFRKDPCITVNLDVTVASGKDLEIYGKLFYWRHTMTNMWQLPFIYDLKLHYRFNRCCYDTVFEQFNPHIFSILRVLSSSWISVSCPSVTDTLSHKFLQTCPDCLIVHQKDKYQTMQLLGRYGGKHRYNIVE